MRVEMRDKKPYPAGIGSMSRRWELNPQPPLYESGALPLSYFGAAFDLDKIVQIGWQHYTAGRGNSRSACIGIPGQRSRQENNAACGTI
jgi:hypothetical protein